MTRALPLAGVLLCLANPAIGQSCKGVHYRPLPVVIARDAAYLSASGAVQVVGYNDMAEMIGELDRIFEKTHPRIRIEPNLQGTRTAPPALAKGTTAFAPMGAPFSPEELATYRAATGTEPIAFRIAHASLSPKALSGPLAVFVHPDNPLHRADLPALASIYFDGAAHTWSELGLAGAWTNQPIHLAGLAPRTALALEFKARVRPDATYPAAYRGSAQSSEVVRQLSTDPLALGFAARNRADDSVKALALASAANTTAVEATIETIKAGRYPLDRYLLIYARRPADGKPEPLVREYLRLVLSCDGQAVIGAGSLGYLPLNNGELETERARLNRT